MVLCIQDRTLVWSMWRHYNLCVQLEKEQDDSHAKEFVGIGDPRQVVMCWAGPKAQPGPAAGPEVGFGRASDMRKPEAWA